MAWSTGIYVTQPKYSLEQQVTIIIHNGENDAIGLVDVPPWTIKNAQDEIIFPMIRSHMAKMLDPHYSTLYFWDQKDIHGVQVPTGKYVVSWEKYKAAFEIA